MAVKIITGAIGSGKTSLCIEQMQAAHKRNEKKRLMMLVPSHYSHETERMLINTFGGTGLNGIECTSFEKLSRELISNSSPILGASGKNALICRAVNSCLESIKSSDAPFDNRLIRAISRRGFIDIAQGLINEMHRYGVTSQAILEYAQTAETEILSQKLKITASIYDNYEKLLSDTDYRDSNNELSRLAAVIGQYFNSDTAVWINKFDEFLPQELAVVYALIDSGADITITFPLCPDVSDTYFGTTAAIESISSYTTIEKIHLDGCMTHIKNAPDLKFLFSTWFDRSVYDDKCENTEIFISRDAYTETEHLAAKILDLVREDGYRFRDIGIICGNYGEYSHIVEAIFEEYDIPYYSDERIAISEYPIAMQILSLFDVIDSNWSYKAMLSYLRSGFIYVKDGSKFHRLDIDKLDLLENYVLKYGINYKSYWCKSWLNSSATIIDTAFETESQKKNAALLEELDKMRLMIIEPILAYGEAVKKSVTVADYCRALFGFFENINLYQGIKGELLSMAMNRADADAQRFGQIWNLMLDVLNQIYTALGNEKATHEDFCGYIRSAMSQCQIRTVPSGIDRVFIGSADMNRSIPTPVIFAIGAVSGTFPTINSNEGFLSNSDREALQIGGIELSPTTTKMTDRLRNSVYKLLSAATEKLYISYPSMTPDGNSNLPSQAVTDIMHKLKNIPVCDDLVPDPTEPIYVSSPKATLHKFLSRPKDTPLWEHIDSWFNSHGKWQNRLFTVNHAKHSYNHRKIELSPELAEALYSGKIRYSSTRLDTYAKCPFSHYLKYGLSAREDSTYEMNAADTGSYAHEIIRRFCTTVDSDPKLSWDNIDNSRCDSIVSQIVDDTISKISASELAKKEVTADILRRMGEAVKKAAQTAVRSIKSGSFVCDGYEKEIQFKLTEDIELCGIIDRLDVCRHDGVNEYRIIDYKTGNKDMSAANIYNGLDMQPVIYALAMRTLDENAVISGMYYGLVHNDFAMLDPTSKESTAESRLRENTAYKGLTFVGNDAAVPPPEEEINRIETELSRADSSLFFSLRGGIKYDKSLRVRSDSELLMDTVRNNIITMNSDIKNGNIAISPLINSSRSACTYCPYTAVCAFDCDAKKDRKITTKDDEAWAKMEEE